MNKMRITFLMLIWLMSLVSLYANAIFSLSATRVIHSESMKESSIEVYNNSENEMLIQGWLDSGGGDSSPPPFAMTPQLVKIQKKQSKSFRIFYQGIGLPKDKESLFWLNILAIPISVDNDESLQIAIQQRIKLFYRPSNLSGDARLAPESLKVTLVKNEILLQNATPYYINISAFRQGNHEVDGDMIEPHGQLSISADWVLEMRGIEIDVINDFGGQDTFKGDFNSGVFDRLKIKKQ